MRTIIAGSRHITDYHLVTKAIVESGFMFEITSVVCGGAPGVDLLGDQFAFEIGLPVQYIVVMGYDGIPTLSLFKNLRPLANQNNGSQYENLIVAGHWGDGHIAAYNRNKKMAARADALIAVRGKDPRTGKPSPGTTMMIDLARQHGLRVHVMEVE